MSGVEETSEVAGRVIGARITSAGINYRVWAPGQTSLLVRVEQGGRHWTRRLEPEGQGYWSGCDAAGQAGDRYRFERADGRLLPDPASRFQPEGVHGPSECIDPTAYRWQCDTWIRPSWKGQTIYEVHVGTLTVPGTYRAALAVLDRVRDLGAEAIELMPLADFAGDRNWGYDGVALYAPARCYGRPDDLRALVDAAHRRGLAVILDVVYNHLGPAGNYLAEYAPGYFRTDVTTPWGHPFQLEGEGSRPVRDFLVGNAGYWLDEFRFDGLRLDATHAIPDRSPRHLLAEITAAVHARGGFVIAEDERNQAEILHLPDGRGYGLDAAWADDFHHQVRVALTGTRDSYFAAYGGGGADLADTLAQGWTYRGQAYPPWAGRPRGSSGVHLPARAFVVAIENHDQVGNRANGERLEHLVTPRQFRAASMLLCLGPYAPLIFMGQEWATASPFLFFTDHGGELGRQIAEGRRREFEQPGQAWGGDLPPDPEAPATFERSQLDWNEREEPAHAATLALYTECLRERRNWLRGAALQRDRWEVRAVGEFVGIRYRWDGGERMLLVALRPDRLPAGPPPAALAPPEGKNWRVILRSEEARFGGGDSAGTEAWRWDGPGAVWLEAVQEDLRHAAP